jgi:hypothetical protein
MRGMGYYNGLDQGYSTVRHIFYHSGRRKRERYDLTQLKRDLPPFPAVVCYINRREPAREQLIGYNDVPGLGAGLSDALWGLIMFWGDN